MHALSFGSKRSWRRIATAAQAQSVASQTCAISHAARFLNHKKKNHNPVLARYMSTTTPLAEPESLSSNGAASRLSLRAPVHQAVPSFKVTKVSYTGNIETVTLQTSELLKSASIFARDLITLNVTSRQERMLQSHAGREVFASIVPRHSVILLCFGSLRAVAGLDHVFLLDADNPAVQDFAEDLATIYRRGEIQSSEQPPEPAELVFLEQVLQHTVDSYHRRLKLLEPILDCFLDRVANEVYSDTGVHLLVPLKDALQAFEIQVKQSLECLTELLNSDDQMLALLLTEQAEASKKEGVVEFKRHEHVELLLGVYARQLNTTALEVSYSLGRLQSKQEFVALALAGYRNRMIRMNVNLSIAGLSFAVGSAVAGMFGMNVVNGFEQSTVAFYYILFGSSMSGLLIATGSFSYLSGNAMRHRASQRLDEIETLTSALSDLAAVDYTLKKTVDCGESLDKERFHQLLSDARHSKHVPAKEVDLLFAVLDRIKDGYIKSEDFIPPRPQTSKSPPSVGDC